MRPSKVVMHEVKCEREHVVFELLREAIGQPVKPLHKKPRRSVEPFDNTILRDATPSPVYNDSR